MEEKKSFFRKHWIFILIAVVCLIWVFHSYFTGGLIYKLTLGDGQYLVRFIDSFGSYGALIFVIIVILEGVIAPIPAFAVYVAGGSLFGTTLGAILTLIGNVLGAIIAFEIARAFGRAFIEKAMHTRTRKYFDKYSQKYGIIGLFILRANPFTSFDFFSYASGLSKMRLRTFVIGTSLGLGFLVFLQAFLGRIFVKSSGEGFSASIVFLSIVYFMFFVYLVVKTVHKVRKKKRFKKEYGY